MQNLKVKFQCFGFFSLFLFFTNLTFGQSPPEEQKVILIRCDDIGMCHSVNLAMKKLIDSGIPFSASVMFTCPWYLEAVELLKKHPEISVGIHLTLNSEWGNYRWGPVLGMGRVPSLVDSTGYFFPSRAKFFANNPSMEEIEAELRAQIERAFHSGLRIDYLDHHMGTAGQTPELRKLLMSFAKEYKLGISRYFGEKYNSKIYNAAVENKTDSLLAQINQIKSVEVNLFVFHIGLDNPEMAAMYDLNPHGLLNMSQHRNAELKALCSDEVKESLKKNHVRFITYQKMIKNMGLESLKNPYEYPLKK
jgi:predicted glycoside hydrolase/deacetylase ChbG (UPF0249 family)